jgi:hypothetical protein
MSFCDNLTATDAKNWCRAEIARLWPFRRTTGRVRITELCDNIRFYSDLPIKRRGMWFKGVSVIYSDIQFPSGEVASGIGELFEISDLCLSQSIMLNDANFDIESLGWKWNQR